MNFVRNIIIMFICLYIHTQCHQYRQILHPILMIVQPVVSSSNVGILLLEIRNVLIFKNQMSLFTEKIHRRELGLAEYLQVLLNNNKGLSLYSLLLINKRNSYQNPIKKQLIHNIQCIIILSYKFGYGFDKKISFRGFPLIN